MRRLVAGLVVVALWCGCKEPNYAALCKDGDCPDPAFPYCDVEGAIYGTPGECVAVTCSPGEVAACLGDDALTCNEAGDGYARIACDLGCIESPQPHCGYIEPRYVPDACDTPASSASFVVTSTATFDPNLDANCNGGVIEQTGAPAICVVRHRRIEIAATAALLVTDTPSISPGRVIAFVVDDELNIDGTLDISAQGSISGPGGGALQSGGMSTPNMTNGTAGHGGGGAGGMTKGGAGGSQSQDAGAANGGAAAADPAFLAALIGGAAAHQLDGSAMTAGLGGGGGGAATLVSCRGRLSVTGMIDAGGGGGAGGLLYLFGSQLPGSGGGAGGYVVLQARDISVTGELFANGGGGGAGMRSNQVSGIQGQDGARSALTPARGGIRQTDEGVGGNGGVGTTLPTNGTRPMTYPASAGGGGGSVGFFQTYTPRDFTPSLTPIAISPAFQPNGVIDVR